MAKPRQHVDRGHHREPVVARHQLAFALAQLRGHRVERAGQRHELGRQTIARSARRQIALAKALGHIGQHLDRLDHQLFGGDQRAEQDEHDDESELEISGADVAAHGRRHLVLVDAGDQAGIGAGDADITDRAAGAVGGEERQCALVLVRPQRLVGDRGHQRHVVERTTDRAVLVGRCRQHGAGAVDQDGGDAGAAPQIAHDLRHPVEVDGGKHDGIGYAAEGGHRVNRHHGRRQHRPRQDEVAQHEAAGFLCLLEVRPVTEIEADIHVVGGALNAPVLAGDQKRTDPGKIRRQARAQHVTALADAAGGGADEGFRFQDGLD
ncbi:hypothetical protein ACVWW2_000857 [Bradyrhizobium sp. LM4.3]